MKKYLTNILTILIVQIGMVFFTNSFEAFSQKIEKFSNLEGFNQNTVNALEKDSYGFLWVGTPNGLIRYDGYNFINEDISFNSQIMRLYNDDRNRLWIGHHKGGNVKVHALNRTYKIPLKTSFEISCILPDGNGNIWISGENKLFVCKLLDDGEGVFEVSDNLLKNDKDISPISQIIFKNDHTLLLSTQKGIYTLSLNNYTTPLTVKTKEIYKFKEFEESKVTNIKLFDNLLWIGTNKGLYKTSIDNMKLHILEHVKNSGMADVSVKKIYKDNKDQIWIGTLNKGFLKYDTKTGDVENYSYNVDDKNGVSSQIINCFYEDDFGVIWIGTGQGGLNKLNTLQKQFINYTHNSYDNTSLVGNLTTSVLEDSRGYLWVSTYNNSICRSAKKVTDKTVRNIEFENLEKKCLIDKKDIIRTLFEDEKGYVWIGSDRSVVVYNPKTNRFKKVEIHYGIDENPLGLCFNILQIDKEHLLLVGTNLLVIKNPWEAIKRKQSPKINAVSYIRLKENKAYKILKDRKDKIWIGSSKGLLKIKLKNGEISIEDRFDNSSDNDFKLSYDKVFSLKEDDQGNILVGTFGGGLNKLHITNEGDVSKIEVFNKQDLLIDNAIYGILEDDSNNMWLSTDKGIYKLNIDEKKLNIFDVRDGLMNNNFRQSSYFKGNSGYYYFGGLKGLTIFKPSEISLNRIPPKVVITKLKVKNKAVEINKEGDNGVYLKKSISETKEISIHENDQILALDIAVQHSAVPSKNKLMYKLEGFNDDWVEEDKGKTTITYTNLSHGNYVLKIKAANGDGVWNEEVTNLNISVLPPWYKTWWSYLFFTVILITSFIGAFRYFVRLEKLQQKLKYEQLDKERMGIANQNKFRFFTNISHEFRTPLSLISGPLERVIEQNNDDNNAKYLAIIQKNTKRLLSLVDQLITFRQAEQGHVKLNLTKTTLGDFIYPITEAFEDYAVEKNINFFYKVNLPNQEIIIDIEKTERILFNLLSNSFKNTPSKGSISIEGVIDTRDEFKIIHFDVVDTGKGIPEKNIKNIFERFYQLSENGDNISGGGIGLAFCKSLVELLGGGISVESKPNIETRFSVAIPSKIIDESNKDQVNTEVNSFIKEWVPLTTSSKGNVVENSEKKIKKFDMLLVEDELDVQSFLVESLSSKYNITVANNGVEGLEKLKVKEPHIIISDVMMDEMDGFEFCKKIKANEDTCNIPVVLLTALGEIEDTITGLELGADEYISKPFSLKELTLRIDRLVKNNERRKEHFSKKSALPDESEKIEISLRDKEFLNDIIDVIEKNISNSNFGVEELSLKVGLSTSQFYRKLKKLTGQIPNAYLRNFRLQRAAELLSSNKGLNVSEVMYSIGIESNSYFSTSFKKLHGVSPSEFLKRYQA